MVLIKKHIILGSHNTKTTGIKMIIAKTSNKISFVLVFPVIQQNTKSKSNKNPPNYSPRFKLFLPIALTFCSFSQDHCL